MTPMKNSHSVTILDAAWRALRDPGPPPRGLVVAMLCVIPLVAALTVATALLGQLRHGDASELFGEKELGTFLSAGLLVACAAICWRVSRALSGPFRAFWVIAALGYGFLTLDELLRIHEKLDFAIHDVTGWKRDHPVTDHIDDAIILAYALALLWAAWAHRASLLKLRWFVLLMIPAAAAFGAMAALDVAAAPKWLEESAKIASETLMVLAFLAALLDMRGQQNSLAA